MTIEVFVKVDRAVVCPEFVCDFCSSREVGTSMTLLRHELSAELKGVQQAAAVVPVSEEMPRGWLRKTNQFSVSWHACPSCVAIHGFPDN